MHIILLHSVVDGFDEYKQVLVLSQGLYFIKQIDRSLPDNPDDWPLHHSH